MSETPLTLADLRERIDAVDADLLALMSRRAGFAQQVAEIKMAAGEVSNFYRPEREYEVLRRVAALNEGPLPDAVVMRLFRELMSACLALEKPLAVAYLGPAGTFSQQAAWKHFGQGIEASAEAGIDDVFRKVESGACHYGVVPVENSTEGAITHTLDSFLHSPLIIAGEVQLRIHHHLLSGESSLAAVHTIFSHQQSLAQCRQWLQMHCPGVRLQAVSSNAEAARIVSSQSGCAAIAGEGAAAIYELGILARHIEDESDNTTRFLVIGTQAVGATGSDRTSLLLSTANHPGALLSALAPFAKAGISLSRIESRPSHRGNWDYVFFMDVDGHQHDEKLAGVLEELKAQACMFKILGSYPKATY
ncbi:MAG: hypothetical protein RIQ52_1749 [Pseudomonadota bacterium]|jgi:chorismate mutase/prephenate dehydratase